MLLSGNAQRYGNDLLICLTKIIIKVVRVINEIEDVDSNGWY